MPEMIPEIWVIPSLSQGHVLACIELCKRIASKGVKTSLVISPNLFSFVRSSLREHDLVSVLKLSLPPPPSPPQPGSHPITPQMYLAMEKLLRERPENPHPVLPVCVVIDVVMMDLSEIFNKFYIPTFAFFTSGACVAAMHFAKWGPSNQEIRLENMAPSDSDLTGGPPPAAVPGFLTTWITAPQGMGPVNVDGAYAVMINSCRDLERHFMDYISSQIKKRVWGVGPLLPEEYWQSDWQSPTNRRGSNNWEDDVIQWLDLQASGSVLFVSFDGEVGPRIADFPVLTGALVDSTRTFIWVMQTKSGDPNADLDPVTRVGNGSLIVRGRMPEPLILNHPSIGGLLANCGWSSTIKAMVRGVPLLAWPTEDEEFYNAKLEMSNLKVGILVAEAPSQMVDKDDIMDGIKKLMGDEELSRQAAERRVNFQNGFPASSKTAVIEFVETIDLLGK